MDRPFPLCRRFPLARTPWRAPELACSLAALVLGSLIALPGPADAQRLTPVRLTEINPGLDRVGPGHLIDVKGTLFFSACGLDLTRCGLWKSDGTAAGTVLLKEISVGGSTSMVMASVNGTLFMAAFDEVSGVELWKSDGTAAGTVLVKDIQPGPDWSSPSSLTNVNGTLFFTACDTTHGCELWKSDGTTTGTLRVKDVNPGGSAIPTDLGRTAVSVNGTVFFMADDGVTGVELWRSDGTEAGTRLVKDIRSGPVGSFPGQLTGASGTLFFLADDGLTGRGLWVSDGTEAGTVRVGNGVSFPGQLTNLNGTLFFQGSDPQHGFELWRSDGTETGTVRVKDIRPGPDSSFPAHLTAMGGALFFSADDGVTGFELWRSDGTETGTVRVKDIWPGLESSFPGGLVFGALTVVGSTLFFGARDGVTGFELWKSDGTEGGTVRVADIDPDPRGPGLSDLTNVDGTLFFSAFDAVSGWELWALVADDPPIGRLVTGAGPGGGPHARLLHARSGGQVADAFVFPPDFPGGVRVAVGDVSGDGVPDLVLGAGPGGTPHVRVLDGETRAEIRSFFAFAPGFAGGVFVAAGDVTGDGRADIVTGAGPGGSPHVRVFDGATGAEARSFFAYAPGFAGGVTVAAGDVSGDGVADIVTGAGPGGGPHVRVFDGATGGLLREFLAYTPGFAGGVTVAAGDVSGDGVADIVTGAGPGGSPHVRVFDGATGALLREFLAYDPDFTGGVFVAAGDVTGDGRADVVTGAGPGGGPLVHVFDGVTGAVVRSFLAYVPHFTGGVFVAATPP